MSSGAAKYAVGKIGARKRGLRVAFSYRHCAVSSAFRALDRHVLPSIAKNGRSIATDLARLTWKFKKSLTKAGEILFLDARMMPRAIAPLASQIVNGMTCGAIETPGSIVLMPLP